MDDSHAEKTPSTKQCMRFPECILITWHQPAWQPGRSPFAALQLEDGTLDRSCGFVSFGGSRSTIHVTMSLWYRLGGEVQV